MVGMVYESVYGVNAGGYGLLITKYCKIYAEQVIIKNFVKNNRHELVDINALRLSGICLFLLPGYGMIQLVPFDKEDIWPELLLKIVLKR
jgi:hypothetical protein